MFDKAAYLKEWRSHNKEAVQEHQRVQYEKEREQRLEYQRAYNTANAAILKAKAKVRRENRTAEQKAAEREAKSEKALLRRYGLTKSEWSQRLQKQNDLCALCREPGRTGKYGKLNVDHCHETGRVRGLLCNRCNHALGNLGDNAEGLARALAYVCQ